jgi:hypothetical protein
MVRRRRSGRPSALPGVAVLIAVGALVIAVFGGIGFYIYWTMSHFEPVEEATLCPKKGIFAQSVVLLDTTDAFADVTRSDVLNKLNDLVKSVPKGGLLDVRVLNENPGQISRVVSLCNPGDGADAPNPDLARKRWEKGFAEPVRDALDTAVAGTEQRYSPILAAIQQVAAELISSAHQRTIPTRIVVVSDLLENTSFYSMFKDGLSFEKFVAKAGARYLTDLGGADVEYWMVQRDRPDIDRTELAEFWLRWTEGSNGHGRVIRLMGM